MSRYTIEPQDIVLTQAMDYTAQFWVTDHRGDAVPFENPAKMTVRDRTGQILIEVGSGDDPAQGSILTSPLSGVVQVVFPRAVTVEFDVGRYSYDVWATIIDSEASSVFPNGQQVPVASGTLVVTRRVTQMESP